MAKTGREVKSFAHLPGCPRLMFWDAGDAEARCECDWEEPDDDPNDPVEMEEALFKAEVARDHALRRISFLRSMIDDALRCALDGHVPNTVIAVLQRALASDDEDKDNHP